MVLDLCALNWDIPTGILFNKEQILEGCATVAIGILASLGMNFFHSDPADLITPASSDGRLPLRCQVFNCRREDVGDMEKKLA